MFLKTLFTQITRKAPSVPRRETCIAQALLNACCACGLVQDEAGATPGLDRWISQRTYRETHGVNPTELELTHTYCPTCFEKVQETMLQFWRKSREEQIGAMTLLTGSRRLPSCSRPGPAPPGAPSE